MISVFEFASQIVPVISTVKPKAQFKITVIIKSAITV
jgi:hypothetical protein